MALERKYYKVLVAGEFKKALGFVYPHVVNRVKRKNGVVIYNEPVEIVSRYAPKDGVEIDQAEYDLLDADGRSKYALEVETVELIENQ